MKTKIEAIDRYIELKKQEKEIQKALADIKDLFTAAADTLARENQSSQIEVSGALIYRRESKVYAYPRSIQVLEAQLKAKKINFEERNDPAEIRAFWAVKF